MTDGQVRGPPNIEQPTLVQKKKLKKISDDGIILPIGVNSHNSGIFTIKNQGIVFGEAEVGVPLGVLSLRYKLYFRKHVLDIVPHNIPYFDVMTLDNNYVSDDDHVHEDVKVDIVVSHVKVVNKIIRKIMRLLLERNLIS